jgi:hypothetical protein
MTPENFARHRNNPNLAFWKMLKRGNDHFEVTRLEPKVDVCEKRYVFDAQPPAGSTTPLSFNPTGKCPAYEVPADILAAVNEKQRSDEYQTAELIARGTKASPIRTGADGGMHPVFLAALQGQDLSAASSPFRTTAMLSTPVVLPRHVVPPRVASQAAATDPAEPPRAQATAAPSQPAAQRNANAGLFSTLYAGANSRSRSAVAKDAGGTVPSATTSTATPPAAATARGARTAPTVAAPAATDKKERSTKAAELPANATPEGTTASVASTAAPTTAPSAMPPAGSFESRWLAITSRSRF